MKESFINFKEIHFEEALAMIEHDELDTLWILDGNILVRCINRTMYIEVLHKQRWFKKVEVSNTKEGAGT